MTGKGEGLLSIDVFSGCQRNWLQDQWNVDGGESSDLDHLSMR